MPLTDTTVKQAKPEARAYKLSDEKGMFLLVTPKGGKLWRLKYRMAGKEKLLALGSYPDITLKQARILRDEARQHIANGTDPGELRKAEKITLSEDARKQEEEAQRQRLLASGQALPGSFRAVALEWAERYLQDKSPKYQAKQYRRLESEVFPRIGNLPVADVSAAVILELLRSIEDRGVIETTRRVKMLIGQVLRYAVVTGRAQYDSTTALLGALAPRPKVKHHAAPIEPKDAAPLLRLLASYQGSPLTRCALTLAPLLFVRPGELRSMEWAHIDFEACEWRYTTSKTGTPHIVPLARQAIEALRTIQPLTGGGRYVFPALGNPSRCMSENTLNQAMHRLGIDTQTQLTAHGFRAMARTLLEEAHGFRPEVIELQLAHQVKDANGNAYNRTRHLAERKRMMQVWADYLDELRNGSNVIRANFAKSA